MLIAQFEARPVRHAGGALRSARGSAARESAPAWVAAKASAPASADTATIAM